MAETGDDVGEIKIGALTGSDVNEDVGNTQDCAATTSASSTTFSGIIDKHSIGKRKVSAEFLSSEKSSSKQKRTTIGSCFSEHATTMAEAEEDVGVVEVGASTDTNMNEDAENTKGRCKQMEVEFADFIKQHKEQLCRLLDANSGIQDKLIEKGAITFKDDSKIKSANDKFLKCEILIDLVCQKEIYKEFIQALEDSNHKHVANLILAKGDYYGSEFGDDMPIKENEINRIRRNYCYLTSKLDISELIDLLWSKDVINGKQREYIKSRDTYYGKNEAFLEILTKCSRSAYKQTIVCLQQLKQIHIAGRLATDGETARFDAKLEGEAIDIEQTGDRIFNAISKPVSNTSLPENNRVSEMVEMKRFKARDGFCFYFATRIACCQLNEVKHLQQLPKSGFLQDTIELVFKEQPQNSRKVNLQMKLTIYTAENNRENVKGNIKLEAVFDFDPQEMSLEEKSELDGISKSKMAEENLDLTTQTLSFKKGDQMQTIDSENIGDPVLWWRVRHLGNGNSGYIPRKLVVVDYKSLLDQGNNGSVEISQRDKGKPISLSNLPFELLDSILLESYLQHFVLKDKQSLKNKDHHAFSQLASVDFCWFQRIRKRKFKNEVWRSLVAFYRRKGKISSIFRINRQYLEENIRLQGLVNRLKSNDYLTDVQTASLYIQIPVMVKKNHFNRFREIVSEAVKKTEAMHYVFRQSLCDTKQHLISEVIEKGGAMTKVEIQLRKTKTSVKTRLQYFQIAQRINQIQDNTRTQPHHFKTIMSKLKHKHMEILSASQDEDVIVVWIWCKNKYALEKLQTLNKSKYIVDILTKLVKNLSWSSEKLNPATIKPKVNIDFEQLEKTIVFFSIVTHFTSRLDLKGAKAEDFFVVFGVTKLRNKIYVLLSRSSDYLCVISVFEDQIPFRLQKRIEIKKIKNPTDIVSIETENSFYVLDLRRDLGRRECVWKIKAGDKKESKEKIIRWLELSVYTDVPENLSVTRNGQQLLLVCRKKDDPFWSLMIFGGGKSKKAEPRLSISLPEDIQWPCHAVETSKGNLIIIHCIIKREREDESGSARVRRKREGEMEKETEEEIEEEMTEEEEIWMVSEVSEDGRMIVRSFIPHKEEKKLVLNFRHLALDSVDQVFLSDYWNDRVILLDSDLQWNGIIMPTEDEEKEGKRICWPRKLVYDEEKQQLIVGAKEEVFVSTSSRK